MSDPYSTGYSSGYDPYSSGYDPYSSGFSSPSYYDNYANQSLADLSAQNAMFGQFDPASMQDPSSSQAIDYTQATQQPISGDPSGQLAQDFGGGQQLDQQQAPQGQQPAPQQPQQQQDSALLNWLRQGANPASDPWQAGAGAGGTQNPELAQPYRTASLTMMPPPGEANFQQRSGEFRPNPNFPSQNVPNPQNDPVNTQINADPYQQNVSGQIPVQAPQQPQQPVPGTSPSAPGTPEEQQGQPQDPYQRQQRQRQARSPVEQMIQSILRQLMASRQQRYPGRYPPIGRFPMMMRGRGRFGRYPFMRYPPMRGGYPQFGGGQGYPGGYQDPTQPVNNVDVPDPREDDAAVPPAETGDQAEPPAGFTGPMHPPDRPPVQPDQLSPEGPAPAGGFAWGPYQKVTPEGPGTTPVEGRPLPPVPGAPAAPDYTAPQQPVPAGGVSPGDAFPGGYTERPLPGGGFVREPAQQPAAPPTAAPPTEAPPAAAPTIGGTPSSSNAAKAAELRQHADAYDQAGDQAGAQRLRAIADDFERNIPPRGQYPPGFFQFQPPTETPGPAPGDRPPPAWQYDPNKTPWQNDQDKIASDAAYADWLKAHPGWNRPGGAQPDHPAPASPADVPAQGPQQQPSPDHAPAPAYPLQPSAGRQPNGSAFPAAVTAVGGASPSALIIHHTGGRGDVNGVRHVLRQRGLGVQYVMDRNGNITQVGGPGSRHMMDGWGAGRGLSNRNTVGLEIIARNNADVTPQQVKAAQAFIAARYPNTPVFGHGQVNPGHKEATEGMAVVNATRQARAGSSQYRMIEQNPTWAP